MFDSNEVLLVIYAQPYCTLALCTNSRWGETVASDSVAVLMADSEDLHSVFLP